ncbi:unnamed protein product [Gongylonema pulchrum]|uniref:Intraflagellar transport protein 56 n=1 Tax=Gongylonema pulchrum TaxID=637853 RepID=A0A183D3D0_9BILA|nr:unnamed protein product [Gongylonema pulchrum]
MPELTASLATPAITEEISGEDTTAENPGTGRIFAEARLCWRYLAVAARGGTTDESTDLWLGHCAFHAGEYRKAMQVYERMLSQKNCAQEVFLYIACCAFYLGLCSEAREYAEKGVKNALQNRLLFHVAHRLKDEKQLMAHHSQLQDTTEDQISLASVHYLRSHYQEAIDIYKKILINNK